MGFFSRLPVPRGMRRATHPEQAVTQAAAPEAVEVANGAPHPVGAAAPVMPSPAAAIIESATNGSAGVWHHDDCKVNHRSAEAAAKCRNR
jgi:hypothetical protein